MALDERDYHSYQLPEHIKEKRLQELKNRFEESTPQTERTFQIDLELPETRTEWALFYFVVSLVIAFVLWCVS